MKKYFLSAIAAVILAVTLCVGAFAADVSVSSADELVAIMNDSSKWADNITLTADINLSGKVQTPIGDYTTPYTGIFDGAGHTVSGLDITGSGTVGLFGVVDKATIKNLTVEGRVENTFGTELPEETEFTAETKLDEAGHYSGTGAVAAIVMSGCTLENLTNRAEVIGAGNAGGVIGIIYNFGDATTTATGCVNYGKVTSTVGNLGGVFGRIYVKCTDPTAAVINECVNYADVSSESADRNRIAGVVGYVRSELGAIEINKCRNEGTITGTNEHMTGGNIPYAGGIAGRCEVTTAASAGLVFADCVNTGKIDSSRCGGGITAYISRGDACFEAPTAVVRCINTGDVTGPYYAGGMVSYISSYLFPGESATKIADCLNVAAITSEDCGGGILGRLVCCDVVSSVNLGTVTAVVSNGAIVGKYDGEYVCSVKDCYYLYAPKSVGNESEYLRAENIMPVASDEAAKQDVYTGLDFETVWTMTAACPVPTGADGVTFNVPAGVAVESYPETTVYEETTAPEETTTEPEDEPKDEPKETEKTTKAPEKTTKATDTAPTDNGDEKTDNTGIIIAVVAVVVVALVVAIIVIKKRK